MTLKELRHELNKLPLEADEWPVQILFENAEQLLVVNEDVLSISANDYVVFLVGESVDGYSEAR